MKVPVHEFCLLVHGWLIENLDEDGRRKIDTQLYAPMSGEAQREPTQAELDADYKAMMSLGARLS